MRSIFFPSTPPPAFISSMASWVPLCEAWPKAASLPVSEANSPTLMVSPPAVEPPPLLLQAVVHKRRSTGARISPRQYFISVFASAGSRNDCVFPEPFGNGFTVKKRGGHFNSQCEHGAESAREWRPTLCPVSGGE